MSNKNIKNPPDVQLSAADEHELAIKAMSGDTAAFSELVTIYTEPLRIYIQSICANATDAEDICQESLRKAYLSVCRYNPEYLFKTWIFSIARNTAIDHLRRKSIYTTVKLDETDEPLDEIQVDESYPKKKITKTWSRSFFIKAIRSLPERYRRIAELRFLRNYSYQEIADELSMPLNTVRTRIRRAKAQLEKIIRK